MSIRRWDKVFEAKFGHMFKAGTGGQKSEQRVWFDELKVSVSHFHGMSDGEVNNELCAVIDHISGLDSIPRFDMERRSSRYNLSDLSMWCNYFRRQFGRVQKKEAPVNQLSSNQFTNKAKFFIKMLIEKGMRAEASMLAVDPMSVELCWNDLIFAGGNRGYTDAEQDDMRRFCKSIGFDDTKERIMHGKHLLEKQKADAGGVL